MPTLVVDTSTHLRAAHPRAMCYKCYNESNFPHHKIIQNKHTSQAKRCLAQHLAQAEGFRSSETCSLRRAPPSPRRGLEKGTEALVGSRLGETPLAWARCSLAQNHSGSPGRPFMEKGLRRASVSLA
ncbi:hypothetical protein DEO72_LG11g2445 [Vigna unguiculata]|uniref:Uncharacterized protein n=1 Tax=Vigna unguiculata TaxID=3917 RepID=A0A4D6NRX6_VIGUN|nr:hypothetical protein DEO72_LG11g2445 [Vigna unguiculata]